MPNTYTYTYTQLYIHYVFAVKYRKAIIQPIWKERLHQYIAGTLQNNGHKLLAINSMPNHLHFFVGLNPKQSILKIPPLGGQGLKMRITPKQLYRNR